MDLPRPLQRRGGGRGGGGCAPGETYMKAVARGTDLGENKCFLQ